jgi:type IX secretion system PorP/SprF family membrane protein
MKNIFKYIAVFSLLVLVKTGMAQQTYSNYNIYTQNRFIYSPAYAADYGQVFVDGKQKWSGLSNADEMLTLGIHSAIGNAKKSGIGLLLSADRRGLTQFTTATFNYAYNAKLAEKSNLAFGLGAGIHNYQLNYSKMVAADESEVLGIGDEQELTRFDARFGLKYNWAQRLELGFSLPAIFTNDYGFNKYFNGIASYNLYALKDKLEIQPSVMLKSYVTDVTSMQWDMNLYTCWDQTIWIQGAYRLNQTYSANSMIVSAGVNLFNIGIGYAFEHHFASDVPMFNNGTHEIQVIYYFDKERKKNRNEDLLNNNQLEMLQDSTEQNLGDEYEKKLDSLRNEIDKLNTAMKLRDVSEFADEILKRLEALDQAFLQKAKEAPEGVVVFFDTNKFNIKPEYQSKLDAYADKVKTSGASITISGYADEIGPEGYNQTLSEKRAQSVKEYLERQGVDVSKIRTQGFGETTNFGKSLDMNRRAECK